MAKRPVKDWMKKGQRVKISKLGLTEGFAGYRGKITSVRLLPYAIRVRRDSRKQADTWHPDFWVQEK